MVAVQGGKPNHKQAWQGLKYDITYDLNFYFSGIVPVTQASRSQGCSWRHKTQHVSMYIASVDSDLR